MFVLGLQGSPRKKGNTSYLLSIFMEEAEKLGARTHVVEAAKENIVPCKGCFSCEKTGYCVTKNDDMSLKIYQLLRKADVIVAASPIYFYSVTAQLKVLIDRSQTLWARKYRFNLRDPKSKMRKGFLLSQGATKGKNLFEGVHLTAKYFYDAVDASYEGALTYRRIEDAGDMEAHETVKKDVQDAVAGLLQPFLNRKKILFACRENACRSQMAAAFTQYLAGDQFEVSCAGSEPVEKINPDMAVVMQEKGVDMAFRKTQSLDDAISASQPNIIVTMGCEEECPVIPGVKRQDWDLPDPAGKSIEFMRDVRDEIEKRANKLIANNDS
ncbi:MAG: NAD(P)H-dependent oxidoreductase [Desulfobacterales bacterium]|nr:MAG: NAD(P)H-dependent oxidoreductase [Desulfobacterales bacterium]